MGEDFFVERRKKENVRPIEIPNKSKLYCDLMNIEHSWSGRMDTNIGNTFIMEAVQLLINSIELFEMGYFDCAYFSLRSAVDISTTMVFLCDIEEESREKYLNDWKKVEDFPLRYQMIKKLSKEGSVFVDMTTNMPSFFKQAEEISQKLNKYVHKQGLHNFYISRNHPIFQVKSQETFVNNFIYFLKNVIGIVAVMRLAIDPFPVLLMDEEILYRCFDSMTEPYSEEFVQEYIGIEYVEDYKKTNFYISTRSSFEDEEKKNEAIFSIVKHQYINTNQREQILEQFHLLKEHDAISTLIALSCNKVVKVYAIGGFLMFFTDRKTNRTKHSWSGADFHNFESSLQKYNQQYDEVYISVFSFNGETYWVEHNELLLDVDMQEIRKIKL